MALFDMALIVTVEADNYDAAIREAREIADGIVADCDTATCPVADIISASSADEDYEYDNDGQRVLYLHPITSDGQPVAP